MENREHAIKLYKKCYHYHMTNIDDETRTKLRITILKIVSDFLSVVLPKQKFEFTEVADVLRESANCVIDFSADKCELAFEALESIIISLLSCPWKTEYHQLKIYGGFLQTRILPHIPSAEIIIRKMGYVELSNGSGLYLLQNEPNVAVLVSLGFECLVASVECKQASALYKNIVSHRFPNFTEKDALLWRFVLSGSIEQNVVALRKTMNKATTDVTAGIYPVVKKDISLESRTSTFDNRRISTPITRTSQPDYHQPDLLNYQQLNIGNLPHEHVYQKIENTFSDYQIAATSFPSKEQTVYAKNDKMQAVEENDPFTSGTMDEHLLASLQQFDKVDVNQEKTTDDNYKSRSRSSEWDFVTDKLRSTSPQKSRHFSDSADTGFHDSPLIYSRTSKLNQTEPVYPPNIVGRLMNDHSSSALVSRGITSESVVSRTSGIQSEVVTSKSSPQSSAPFEEPPIVQDCGFRKNRESYHEPKQLLQPPFLNQRSKSEPIVRKVAGRKSLLTTNDTYPIARRARLTPEKSYTEHDVLRHEQNMDSSFLVNRVGRLVDSVHSDMIMDDSQFGHWRCTFCTVLNNLDDRICKECFKSRLGGPELEMPHSGESRRVCEQCTLENKADAEVCEVCGGSLKNVCTYI